MQPEDQDQSQLRSRILQHLVDTGQIEGAAAGITRQMLARGEGTLSERQEWVFENQVEGKYLTRVCYLCEQLIPLSEVMQSWTNGDLCANCALILGKEEKGQ
jgi:hypothetical protein